MGAARRELQSEIDFHCFLQFIFFRQLDELRKHAQSKVVRIIGDVPLFVSANSADVWANAGQFLLDRHGRPKFVSGVPPDYFSKTGQRWGNPLYNWPAMRREGFAWWINRIEAALRQADLVRIDHFRGLEACWAIPASQPTAKHGRWAKAPGRELLMALRRRLRRLPFIAEDLGLITPAVVELRDEFHIPGMRVLQFGFGSDGKDPFLPHNFARNCVAYTGTHDNDTTAGWFATLDQKHLERLANYSGADASTVSWDLIRLAWSSVADLAIAPAQDLLGLGSEARMNLPGHATGNWKWRLSQPLAEKMLDSLAELTMLCDRWPRESSHKYKPRRHGDTEGR
jgi:4-alpha-glucanotransferase